MQAPRKWMALAAGATLGVTGTTTAAAVILNDGPAQAAQGSAIVLPAVLPASETNELGYVDASPESADSPNESPFDSPAPAPTPAPQPATGDDSPDSAVSAGSAASGGSAGSAD